MNAAAGLIEVSQHWGDSLLRVERFPRGRRVTVGPAATCDFVAALDEPAALVDAGAVHGDEGSVEIDAATDVEVGVGDIVFRVRSVAPERPVPRAVQIDWMFAAAILLAALLVLAMMVFAVLAFFAIVLVKVLFALLLSLLPWNGKPVLPMSPIPPPLVVSAKFVPPDPPAPSRPFFTRATPAPAPTITPIPIGDQPLTRHASSKKLIEERVAVLGMLNSMESSDFATLSALGSGDTVAMGGLVGRGEGVSGISGLSGGGAGLGELRGSGRGLGGGGSAVGLGTGRIEKIEKVRGLRDEVSDEAVEDEIYEEGGIEGGVAGGVVGGVVGGVIAPPPPPPPGGNPVGGGFVALGTGDSKTGTGALDKDVIQRVVRANLADIQACYERALLAQPDLSGRVDVTFVILPNGSVGSAHVNPQSMPAVGPCIVREIGTWRFPKPVGGSVTVKYPFIFRAAE